MVGIQSIVGKQAKRMPDTLQSRLLRKKEKKKERKKEKTSC